MVLPAARDGVWQPYPSFQRRLETWGEGMGRKDMREAFAEAYMRLVEEAGGRRVSVVDLTTSIGCERKTFYRYFDDVDDLVIWVYRDAMRRAVETELAGAVPVLPHPALHDKYADWPFYARIFDENGFLAQGPYFEASARHFESHSAYYAHIFRQQVDKTGCGSLLDYMRTLFLPAIREDALLLLHGKIVPMDHIEFLADYHTTGIMERLYLFICRNERPMSTEDELHWNYAHIAIERDLNGYFAQPAVKRSGTS